MDMISLPIMVAVIYGIVEAIKYADVKKKFINFLPIIGSLLGITLSLVVYYIENKITIADNVLSAVLVGLICGLSATGSHQIIKQMKEFYSVSTLEDNNDGPK